MILITCGLRFPGGKLAKHLLDKGKRVLLTRTRNANISSLLMPHVGKGLEVAPLDITQLTTILNAIKKYKVSSIVHGAAADTKTPYGTHICLDNTRIY